MQKKTKLNYNKQNKKKIRKRKSVPYNIQGTNSGLMMLRVLRMRFAFLEGEDFWYRFLFCLPLFFCSLRTGGSVRNASSPMKGPFMTGIDLQYFMYA